MKTIILTVLVLIAVDANAIGLICNYRKNNDTREIQFVINQSGPVLYLYDHTYTHKFSVTKFTPTPLIQYDQLKSVVAVNDEFDARIMVSLQTVNEQGKLKGYVQVTQGQRSAVDGSKDPLADFLTDSSVLTCEANASE